MHFIHTYHTLALGFILVCILVSNKYTLSHSLSLVLILSYYFWSYCIAEGFAEGMCVCMCF